MTEKEQLVFNLKLSELTAIWKKYCQLHTELYDLTCDEYVHLLASDMDQLEQTLDDKNTIIETINQIENKRTVLIEDLNQTGIGFNIKKVTDVVEACRQFGIDNEGVQLEKYNLLLLDIITKIQDQNKLNQLFLNKAILSLRELKESFSGRKTYKTYGANGATSSRSVNP